MPKITPRITSGEIDYLLRNAYNGMQEHDPIWIKAFKIYNEDNSMHLGMKCAPCYYKVAAYHMRVAKIQEAPQSRTYFMFSLGKIHFKAGNPGNIWERKRHWIPILKRLSYHRKKGVGFYCYNFAFEIHTKPLQK